MRSFYVPKRLFWFVVASLGAVLGVDHFPTYLSVREVSRRKARGLL